MDDIYGNREYEGCEAVVIFLNGLHEGLLDFISQIPAKLEQDFVEILPGPARVCYTTLRKFRLCRNRILAESCHGLHKFYISFTKEG